MSAVSRLADVRDWKFEVLVLNDCFHRHQTFAALCINDRLADGAAGRHNKSEICIVEQSCHSKRLEEMIE
ncbi:hypothetical protein C1J05_05855 [Sulfitobacter sp. JL08]|nr:hypothetical protein C1J05_05855 [Sulfitobacter sp. JL08]